MTLLRVFLAIILLASATVGTAQANETLKVVLATWRGCEDACRGATNYLENLDVDIDVLHRDAGRDMARARGILEEARALKADLIISWGTSVTLETAGTLDTLDDPSFNHDTPQVFMIVADPVGAGIVESLAASGRGNLTGTYNRVPEKIIVGTLRRLLPDLDTLGLLYNTNEENSIGKRDELAGLLPEMGIRLIDVAFPLSSDGSPRAEDIAPEIRRLKDAGADALYVGSSSFLRSNAVMLGSASRDADLPVISPYEEMVANGDALISVAAKYYKVGQLAGRLAEAILIDGVTPGDLPIAKMKDFALTINLSFAGEIGIWPPIDLLQLANIVR